MVITKKNPINIINFLRRTIFFRFILFAVEAIPNQAESGPMIKVSYKESYFRLMLVFPCKHVEIIFTKVVVRADGLKVFSEEANELPLDFRPVILIFKEKKRESTKETVPITFYIDKMVIFELRIRPFELIECILGLFECILGLARSKRGAERTRFRSVGSFGLGI